MTNAEILSIANKAINDEISSLQELKSQLTDDFAQAAQAIYNTKGRVVITGIGKSGLIGMKIAATMASTGTPAMFMHPVEAFHGDLGMIMDGDIVIAISNSGYTDELLRLLPSLQSRGIKVIAFTGNPLSLLAQHSDFVINIAVEREACPLNLAPTSSTTATLVMGDALAISLMHLRNFQKDDFAKHHPGGKLGYRLLTQVKDVMRTDNLPIVHKSMLVSDTVTEISKSKLGLVVLLDSENIVGIVTDGDIRRAMQQHKELFFTISVEEIMSTSPITVSQTMQIDQADKLMTKMKIHSLLVVDENEHLIGILDSLYIQR